MARVIASVLMAALALGAIALTGGGELSRVQTVFGMNTASGAPSGASTAVGANATPMVTATTGGPMVVLGLGDSVMAGTGCGCDGIPEIYDAIRAGYASSTVMQDAKYQAALGLSMALAAKQGKLDVSKLPPEKRDFMIPGVEVTKDNVDQVVNDFVKNTPTYDLSDFWAKMVK